MCLYFWVPIRKGPYIFDIPFFNEDVIREIMNNAVLCKGLHKQAFNTPSLIALYGMVRCSSRSSVSVVPAKEGCLKMKAIAALSSWKILALSKYCRGYVGCPWTPSCQYLWSVQVLKGIGDISFFHVYQTVRELHDSAYHLSAIRTFPIWRGCRSPCLRADDRI